MSLLVAGLGTAQPPGALTREAGLRLARRVNGEAEPGRPRLPGLYRRAGVDGRRVVLPDELVRGGRGPTTGARMRHYARHAAPLALAAARGALDDAGWEPPAVSHLVTASCTGFAAPGWDVALIKGLGLSPRVARTHVGFMGCHAAVNALRAAAAFAADPATRVLVCAVELCSLHVQHGPAWDKAVANALFADGAAALAGAPAGGAPGWRLAATGSCLFPESEHVLRWEVGAHGFELTLSADLPGLIGARLRPWLESWLAARGVSLAQVASWAVHPGGPRVLGAVERALGLPRRATAASRAVLARCGNMSSATLLFILESLRRRQAPRPCVALGFGPGLVAEAALFL